MKDQGSSPESLPGSQDTCIFEGQPSPRTAAKRKGDFARLIPVNRPAMLAFDEIVKTLKLDPQWNLNARRFIHYDDSPHNLPLHWKGSETDTDTEIEPNKIWIGYYRLNLDILPSIPSLGWILGGGRSDMKDQGVDFLLTLQKKQHHVHGRHARLKHHPESGILMLIVDQGKMVVVNGKERVEGSQRAIATIDTGLSIGDLDYRVEFTLLTENTYREQLANSREWLNSGNKEPLGSLEITPSENHFEYHGFFIQTPFGAGGMVWYLRVLISELERQLQ